MDAVEVLNAVKRYDDYQINLPEVGLLLVMAGCSGEEVVNILDKFSTRAKQEQKIKEEIPDEQEIVQEKHDNCICSEKSFESYGCTCQKRIQPGY